MPTLAEAPRADVRASRFASTSARRGCSDAGPFSRRRREPDAAPRAGCAARNAARASRATSRASARAAARSAARNARRLPRLPRRRRRARRRVQLQRDRPRRFHSAYLGYYAFAPHAGAGYMARASRSRSTSRSARSSCIASRPTCSRATRARSRWCKRAGFTREGYSRRYIKIARPLARPRALGDAGRGLARAARSRDDWPRAAAARSRRVARDRACWLARLRRRAASRRDEPKRRRAMRDSPPTRSTRNACASRRRAARIRVRGDGAAWPSTSTITKAARC